MRLLSNLLDYSIFAESDDSELFEFCRCFVSYKKNNQWSESQLQSIFLPVITETASRFSLVHLLKTISFMRHWINLSDICSIILTFRFHYHESTIIDVKDGGSVVIKNFKKMDFSISGRINTIISLLELR